ncbi:Ribosome-binding factor A [Pontivivens insulae]|uniref:Ribosome-binding factor A n=2 Tax=Pontivivens insulae TaxID=1639689 RepID=A0A2R8AF32_9RHOB|nr:ribosome-binding factor A [Pontivivens insulae]SPF30822.1 Ribosome-binding factor A [Pontivivens insulae]
MRAMAKRTFHEGAGPSQRQLRVGELVRRALSDVLMRGDIHDPDLANTSVTVGEVRMSPDLKHATAFVMPLGGGDVQSVIKALARNKGELRRAVTKSMTLKFSPDLRFRPDVSFDQMDETRRLLDSEEVRRDLGGEED